MADLKSSGADALAVLRKQLGHDLVFRGVLAYRKSWSLSVHAFLDRAEVLVKFRSRPGRMVAAERSADPIDGVVKYLYADALDQPLAGGETHFTIREWEKVLLSGAVTSEQWRLSPQQGLSQRSVAVEAAARGIAALHESGLIHGDVRPDNIAITSPSGEAKVIDYDSAPPAELLDENERAYRAPDATLTPSADVYGLGVMLYEIVAKYSRLEDINPYYQLSTRQLTWLSELARSSAPSDRPTARLLAQLLAPEYRQGPVADAWRAIDIARVDLLRAMNLANRSLISFSDISDLGETVSKAARAALIRHPETAASLVTAEAARSLLALLPIDIAGASVHTHAHDRGHVEREYVNPPQGEIDDDFRTRLEQRADELAEVDPAAAEEELTESIDFANKLRLELLSKVRCFSEDGLARLMTRPDLAVSADGVATLREWNYLLAVPDHGKWLYPAFQFDQASGAPFEVVHEVLEAFPENESPWTILSWWLTKHPKLQGHSPSEALHDTESGSELVSALEYSFA